VPAPLLVVIVGPTGSGKSELALHLAEAVSGEILGCDSVQVYKSFDIASAKILACERRGIPHHLIDICDPEEVFTAGEYALRARRTLLEIAARGRVAIVVGGTGFYLRALLEGLFPGPQRDEALRARLSERERRRSGSVHRLLRRFDPESARRIHVNDVNKTIRALEVTLLGRKPMSEQFAEGRDVLVGFHSCKIGLNPPRPELSVRLDQRVERMFAGGLIEEVRHILALGISTQAKPFESLGYRQALAYVEGSMSWAEAIASAQRETRRYAKRQMTWFRRDRDVNWFGGFGSGPTVQNDVLEYVRVHMH
jgi:tRNA dimethylallyltransferase